MTYTKCDMCGKPCCFKDGKNQSSLSCSIDMHQDKYFGLLCSNRMGLFGETKRNYKKPTKREVTKNTKHTKKHWDRYYEEHVKD